MSGSVVQLSTDVANTIETLEDLSKQLKEDEYDFADSFSRDCSSIISALQELDAIRVNTHHLLEAESITASALRHKLITHVSKLQAEAAAAVSSARDSNKSHLQRLQDKLSSMSNEAASLVKKHEILELHNDVLIPELKKLQTKHDDLVRIMNEKMMERTELQILLNESMQQLQSTKDKIGNLTDEIALLEEELMKKKEETEIEKNRMLQLIDSAKSKLNKQYEENLKLEKELDDYRHQTVETEVALQEMCQLIRETEENIEKLKTTEEKLKLKIDEQKSKMESLKIEGKEIEVKINEKTNDFASKKQNGEEVINKLIEEIDHSKNEANGLNVTSKKTKKDFKIAKEAFDMQNSALLSVRESVNNAKQSLMSESQDGVRLETEIKELEFRLNQLHETHKMNVQLFKEEIADMKDKLMRERKTRQAVEDSYDDLQTQIHNQISEQSEAIHSLTASIEESEQEGKQLSQKKEELQCNIKDCKSNIIALTKELDDLQRHTNHRQSQLEQELTSLEDSIAVFTEEIEDCTDQLRELEPKCIGLEKEYMEISDQYESTKKSMIGLKNHKASLSDTCKRLQQDLEKIHIPQDILRMDTLRCRAYTRKNLREQKNYVEQMEKAVSDKEIKLKAILTENNRFKEAISHLEHQCTYLSMYCDNRAGKESDLQTKIQDIRESLKVRWKGNIDLEKQYSEKDKEFLTVLSDLQINSAEQIERLSVLANQFDQEMRQFTSFLKRLANPYQTKILTCQTRNKTDPSGL